MIFCGNLHRNRDHISVNRHKFQSETRYLALHVCELRRTQEYHCSPESLSSPCRAMLNTARDSTRFFARSPFFCVYHQREERSWRPCLSAYPFGQDRKFPRHSIYSVIKDHERIFCPPHFYWQKNRHFYKQNEKIFLFFPSVTARILCPLTSIGKKTGIACCASLCLYVFFFFCNYKYLFFFYIHIVGSW